jgi:hypothetical protein
MPLSLHSIQEIQQMLQERIQILNLQPRQALHLDTTSTMVSTLDLPKEHFDFISFYLDATQLQPLDAALNILKQALKPQGITLFACTGIEMHDLGDALLKAGFADPVTDREQFESEVIFAYAWHKPATQFSFHQGEVAIPISSICKTNKNVKPK